MQIKLMQQQGVGETVWATRTTNQLFVVTGHRTL